MKRIIFLILVVLIGFVSCERKSGPLTYKGNYRTSQNQQFRIQQSPSKSTNQSQFLPPKNSDQIMTASEIFEKFNSAVFMIYTFDGLNKYQGSGFFISPNGVAVSNYHVFKGTSNGYDHIKLFNGTTYKLKNVIAENEDDDIIVFEVESNGNRFNYIPIANKTPKIGEQAYAIGSPRGLENTFSSGEISQLRGENLIQISVPIDHGSSGGALLNAYGEAIGITTAIIGNSGANLNFAVNIKVLSKYLRQ